MASSEDEKVPAAPPVLQSVTETPVGDHPGDKQPVLQLETNKIEKTNEDKVAEAPEISNEDTVQSRDPIAEVPTEPEQDGQADEVPAETVNPGPEAAVDAADSARDGEETGRERSETQEEQREDGLDQTSEAERDGVKAEEQKEADAEKEQVEDEADKTGSAQEGETQEEEPQHVTAEDQTEDSAERANLNRYSDSIDANIIDPTSVGVTTTKAPPEQEPIEGQLVERHKDDAPEETEHPEPDEEAQAPGPNECTNETVEETRDTAEESEQTQYIPKGLEDENTSQDGGSVIESEMDSESKIDPGSPATIKPDVESDSGSSSAADSNSLDLNLSISSFLSKTKEGSSISLQVRLHTSRPPCGWVMMAREIPEMSLVCCRSQSARRKL